MTDPIPVKLALRLCEMAIEDASAPCTGLHHGHCGEGLHHHHDGYCEFGSPLSRAIMRPMVDYIKHQLIAFEFNGRAIVTKDRAIIAAQAAEIERRTLCEYCDKPATEWACEDHDRHAESSLW